jgi:hypothetical protein
MMAMVVAAAVLLVVATVAVFLGLLAFDIALLVKLRSSIPQQQLSDATR